MRSSVPGRWVLVDERLADEELADERLADEERYILSST